uniref:Protein lifeguard 4 n=1 Tax=Soboliphyme baturini TaxID=241478 RepID=A0A183IMM2_9BILA
LQATHTERGVLASHCPIIIVKVVFNRLRFIRKVLGILAVQLVASTVVGAAFLLVPGLAAVVRHWTWMLFLGLILSFVLLIAMYVKRHRTPTNYILLALWAFFLTCCVVVTLFFYTFQTRHDFSAYGTSLYSLVCVLIAGGIVQMFLQSDVLELVLALAGAIIFSLFITFDLNLIINKLSPEEYIVAVINLYLDITNLFLYLLRLINVLKKD